MVSRRAFLRGGGLAGLASLVPVVRAQVHARAGGAGQPFEAVCDTRHAQGDAFLGAVSARAFRSHGVGADPGAVLGVVADATAAGRLLLGLTTPSALMIARQVAAPHGYGLVFHGEHDVLGDGRFQHRLHGDEAWLKDVADLLQHATHAWPTALGRTLAGLPADRECGAMHSIGCATAAPPPPSVRLASWLLAPLRA
ncbi:hypothetical protein [Thauera propionica]|uniref:hypothetical protein n=1 Tax=Thauera propionica TaxID=2019431 RepID=UPI0023F3CEF3|nr:hypothetical protein [Thauera propionica]MDD3675091.1 hypothetical protein [Thauera propionica]